MTDRIIAFASFLVFLFGLIIIPTINKNTIIHPEYEIVRTLEGTTLRLFDEIPRIGGYRSIATELKDDTKVTIEAMGYGGDVLGFLELKRALKGKHVTVVFYGPVFSAHAMLITLADKVEFSQDMTFMFHHHSEYRQELATCRAYAPEELKPACIESVKTKPDTFGVMLRSELKGMISSLELERVLDGEDVYVYGEVIKQRMCTDSELRKKVNCQ